MRFVKKILKYLGVVLLIPVMYFVIGVLCSYITITPKTSDAEKNKSIYIATNGIHLEIIIPKTTMDSLLLNGLQHTDQTRYVSFGWGEKTYYTKAATSMDFTNVNRFQAALLNTPSLLHVTNYTATQHHWIEIKTTATQLIKLQRYINGSFAQDNEYHKIIIPQISYGNHDRFYESNASYNCLYTCNTWVNTAFKQSDMKACLWTPFDFGLLRIYKN
ncbi:DUF2459 domain-containing protein [uncultured Aquimarina sp.]|uniref:DUF2459 domain-containing protein n=1 Tax=uncultured Aquimarina sp. TaxID=575652 RepID=UPI00260FEEF8|nr:DUF2459 domain-containing protein [uncultured Aquimarina sp.]